MVWGIPYLTPQSLHRGLIIVGVVMVGLLFMAVAIIHAEPKLVVARCAPSKTSIAPGITSPEYAIDLGRRFLIASYDFNVRNSVERYEERWRLLDVSMRAADLARFRKAFRRRQSLDMTQEAYLDRIEARQVGDDRWVVSYTMRLRAFYANVPAGWWKQEGVFLLAGPGDRQDAQAALGVKSEKVTLSEVICDDDSLATQPAQIEKTPQAPAN